MFRSKRFFISLFIAIFIGILWAVTYVTSRDSLPKIFEYIPTNMDQVMVNRAEKNIANNTNMLVDIPLAVQEQFQQIKVMIIVQDESFSGEQILFLETKSDFNPRDFLETINPEDDTLFTYLRLDDDQYVFGPQLFIQNYTKPTTDKSLFLQPQLHKYLSTIRKSSLSVVSHNNDLLSSQKQLAWLLDSAEYLLMSITSDKWNFDFASYILLNQPQTGLQSSFKPQFTSLLKESTVVYLELGNILSSVDISSQLISWSVQDALLQKLLAHNIALVISKWANMFNLGLTLVSNDESLYTDLEQYLPMLGVWIQNQPMLSGNQITSVQQPNKIGYDITIQGIQKVGIYLEKRDNQTILSIGNPIVEGKKIKLRNYSKKSLAVIQVDMNQLLDIYKQFSNIGIWWLSADQESMFTQMKDKTLYGNIAIEEKEISIKGSIK